MYCVRVPWEVYEKVRPVFQSWELALETKQIGPEVEAGLFLALAGPAEVRFMAPACGPAPVLENRGPCPVCHYPWFVP